MTTTTREVMTVLGPVPVDELGRTSIHEHLLFNLETYLHQPPDPAHAPFVEVPLALENLWWVREHPMASRHNLVQADPAPEQPRSSGSVRPAARRSSRCRASGSPATCAVSSRSPSGPASTSWPGPATTSARRTRRRWPADVEEVTDELVRDLREGLDGTTSGPA